MNSSKIVRRAKYGVLGALVVMGMMAFAEQEAIQVDNVTPCEQWCKITVNYTLRDTIEARDYVLVFEVTAGGQTASVTDGPAKLTNGAATRVIDTEALFGRQVFDENAKVKVSLKKVVDCQQLWRGGPFWAECNVGATLPGDYGNIFNHSAAQSSVSAPWRVPSEAEIDALLSNCEKVWETRRDSEGQSVVGYCFKGAAGCGSNSIFLPAAGYAPIGSRWSVGDGYYWTSAPPSHWWDGVFADGLYFCSSYAEHVVKLNCSHQMSVRAVRDEPPLEGVGTSEKPFQLGEWTPLEYVAADGTIQSRPSDDYELLTDHTSTIGGGRWYAVTGTVSRGMIVVNGSAHVVLCDGSKLTVTGELNQPGIAVTEGNTLTIYGQTLGTGELVTQGGGHGSGIGGGYYCPSDRVRNPVCGTVTINGGRVVALGGESSAGIGGNHGGPTYIPGGDGGTVTINGGTVTATGGKGADGIGGGLDAGGGVVTINGGNVVASSLGTAPKNSAGKVLHKVTLLAPAGAEPVFKGLGDYGLCGVVPVDGKFCFYLPDGGYDVTFGTATGPHGYYFFIVNGQDVVCSLQQRRVTVNGEDISTGSGSGWAYSDYILKLNGSEAPLVISGISTLDDVQVQVASDCTVDLNDAIICTMGRPAFVVEEGVTATLRMKGGVSHLAATNGVDGTSVSAIEVNGTLNLDFAPDADHAQSAIYAFNFDESPAIGGVDESPAIAGTGTVSVVGGHLCAWSDKQAVGSNCTFRLAESSYGKMLGQVGNSWYDVKLVGNGYPSESVECHKYSKLEVAPAYYVAIPAVNEHVSKITVSNNWEKLLHDPVIVDGASTNRYFAMLDDTVTITYEIEARCVLVGENPLVIPLLTNNVVVLPDVRRPLTITLPESIEGETYVVREDGVEIEGQVEAGGKKVYPVLSGYDIEIVCTAQEGWRIVSETNVVTFANIQERQVLTAAKLPRAWRLFTVNVPAVPAVECSVTSTDSDMAETEPGRWQILSNAEVTVTFTAAANYRIVANGTKTWTLTGDVTFGTTKGFLRPTVEGIPGTEAYPWTVGENVQAYTNAAGVLTITGMGAMSDFASAADVPWDPTTVTAVAVGEGVTKVGKNAFAGIAESATVNGTALSYHHEIADAMGITAAQSSSGAISPAEFERIDIVDGKAYLDVSVYTNSEVKAKGEGEGWGVATNSVIEVPAPGKRGFFYLMSKGKAE